MAFEPGGVALNCPGGEGVRFPLGALRTKSALYVCERTPWCRTFMFGDENFHVCEVANLAFGDTNSHFMFANMAHLVGVAGA